MLRYTKIQEYEINSYCDKIMKYLKKETCLENDYLFAIQLRSMFADLGKPPVFPVWYFVRYII